MAKQKYKEAIIDFSKAIELEPDFELAYSYRGMSYTKTRKLVKANDEFIKAKELRKKNRII